ncbi:MAG: hypothetical protein GX549_05845, partial [Clostridiales bacterium]|nr:hypothetical protein [Clostridiales bacterium]
MEEQVLVAGGEKTPDAAAAAVGPDDGAQDAVEASELLTQAAGSRNEDGNAAASGGEEAGKRHDADGSQAAIDRALGERLRRERRKWEQQHMDELGFARSMARLHPGRGYDDILRASAGGESRAIPNSPPEAAAGAANSLAALIVRETEEVQAQHPEFDPREFIQDNPEGVAKMRSGYSLRDAYVLTRLPQILADSRQQGETLAASRIRARNARV